MVRSLGGIATVLVQCYSRQRSSKTIYAIKINLVCRQCIPDFNNSGAKKVFAKVCSSFRHAEFVAVSSGLSDSANSKEVRYFNFGDASNDFISKN